MGVNLLNLWQKKLGTLLYRLSCGLDDSLGSGEDSERDAMRFLRCYAFFDFSWFFIFIFIFFTFYFEMMRFWDFFITISRCDDLFWCDFMWWHDAISYFILFIFLMLISRWRDDFYFWFHFDFFILFHFILFFIFILFSLLTVILGAQSINSHLSRQYYLS
jgi:hypothetical protein